MIKSKIPNTIFWKEGRLDIIRTKLKGCFLLLILFILSSCSYYQDRSLPEITTLFPPEKNHIETIAILPFKNLTDNEEAPTILRKALFSNLILKDYDLIKISQIDQRLETASYHTTGMIEIEYSKLAELLEADALIYGTVTKCTKFYGVVYSRVAIGAEMEMVDASDAEVIWKVNHIEYSHSGLPPLSPFSIVEKIFESKANVRDKVIVETANKLAKKLVESIPECNSMELHSPYNLVVEKEAHGIESEIFEDYENNDVEIRSKFAINIEAGDETSEVHYKVQPKDTLYKIAKKFYGLGSIWRNIKDANNEIETSSLRIGSDLVLPDVPIITDIDEVELLDKERYKKAVYRVKTGDSLYDLASILYKDRNKWHVIYEDNKDDIVDKEELFAGQVLIIPLTYEDQIISSPQVFNTSDETSLLNSYY